MLKGPGEWLGDGDGLGVRSSTASSASLPKYDEILEWENVCGKILSFSRMDEKEERETRSGVEGRECSSAMALYPGERRGRRWSGLRLGETAIGKRARGWWDLGRGWTGGLGEAWGKLQRSQVRSGARCTSEMATRRSGKETNTRTAESRPWGI